MKSRKERKKSAEQTLQILERGYYELGGRRISIYKELNDAIVQSSLYTPDELDTIRDAHAANHQSSTQTVIEVTTETTLEAARRLVEGEELGRVTCLNFASAKNPGGGFLGGSQAQEESLARSSGLYKCLTSKSTYYQRNRHCSTKLYTDHLIWSPYVPVFRDDDGNFLENFFCVGFITAPAVNAGIVRKQEKKKRKLIEPTMARRIANVLAIASKHNQKVLVLGAWGCGVFQNDPSMVSRLFRENLRDSGPFSDRFRKVVFAIPGGKKRGGNFEAFQKEFSL